MADEASTDLIFDQIREGTSAKVQFIACLSAKFYSVACLSAKLQCNACLSAKLNPMCVCQRTISYKMT